MWWSPPTWLRAGACAVAVGVAILAPAAGRAALQRCVAGGSVAAPLDFHDPATWSPAGVPDAGSDLRLDAACAVRCESGECHAHTLRGTHPEGSFEVAPGASLVLAGCDDASAYQISTYECGAENGFRFAPQGAVVHDSATDGDPFVRGAALPGQPDRMRLVLASPIDVAPGDWLQIRSGPSRSHVYRVEDADVSGCPDESACWLDAALHDPDMEFGNNPLTSGFATGIGYVGAPGSMRVAGRDHPQYEELELDRCVELCTQRSGDDCSAAATVARHASYVGWMLGASDAALDPASPAVMQRRMLVVDTRNGVAPQISPGAGVVDRVCFAEPMPAAWIPAVGHRDRPAVLWPGFWPGDAWVLFRPASVRYAAAEGDGGLGFHGACLDADFAYFDGWSKIAAVGGTPACQTPLQDSVVVAWSQGIGGVDIDQHAACNGHSLDVRSYPALRGDRVALVDTRTAVDMSDTCYPPGSSGDPATDSGTHGLALAATAFDPLAPPAEWIVRYAGDDGVFIAGAGLGPAAWRMPRWTWWWNKHGISTELVDFLNSDPGQTVRVEDGRAVMYAAGVACKGAFDDPTGNVAYHVDGLLYVDPLHDGGVIGLGAESGTRHETASLLAFGETSADCAALRGGSVRDSWIRGWSRLVGFQVRELSGVYYASHGGTASGSVLGSLPPGQSVALRDFVARSLPPISLVASTCGAGCDLEIRDGFAAWAAPFTAGVANFSNGATAHLVAPVEGLLFQNSRLLNCSAGWGESGVHIGRNLLVSPPSGVAIGNAAQCPAAAAQEIVTATGLAAALPVRAELEGERFGPLGRVGLPAAQAVAAGAGLVSPFAIPAEPCANGVDDDWDGAADGADLGCSGVADASERTSAYACDDGQDNDGDGLADAGFDPGCPLPVSHYENPACDDGQDNDGDGFIDFADPQCSAAWPFTEAVPKRSCGLGAELAALALVLRRLGRRLR
jgi:hypothetical protein